VFFDEELKEDEMWAICGVYQVYHSPSEEVAQKSWWPKQSTWESSGMFTGYWTPACESWFQGRIKEIETGKAILRNKREW
ncbi:hypothetical protein BDN72DRAFT_741504, partial [Pluteus cervinus]